MPRGVRHVADSLARREHCSRKARRWKACARHEALDARFVSDLRVEDPRGAFKRWVRNTRLPSGLGPGIVGGRSATCCWRSPRIGAGAVVFLAHTPQFFPFRAGSWNPDERASRLAAASAAVVVIANTWPAYVRRPPGAASRW